MWCYIVSFPADTQKASPILVPLLANESAILVKISIQTTLPRHTAALKLHRQTTGKHVAIG